MTIELPGSVEEPLRDLARRQDREIGALVEDAVRQYLEAAAITDLDSAEIAESQAALVSELSGIPAWKAGGE